MIEVRCASSGSSQCVVDVFLLLDGLSEWLCAGCTLGWHRDATPSLIVEPVAHLPDRPKDCTDDSQGKEMFEVPAAWDDPGEVLS